MKLEKTLRFRCYDCAYLAPVDVFKGICHITKKMVMLDDPACSNFKAVEKCKFCKNFQPLENEEDLGLCMGKELTYPELITKTCEMFEWRDELVKLFKIASTSPR